MAWSLLQPVQGWDQVLYVHHTGVKNSESLACCNHHAGGVGAWRQPDQDYELPDVQSCSGQGASRRVLENLVPGIGHTAESSGMLLKNIPAMLMPQLCSETMR